MFINIEAQADTTPINTYSKATLRVKNELQQGISVILVFNYKHILHPNLRKRHCMYLGTCNVDKETDM